MRKFSATSGKPGRGDFLVLGLGVLLFSWSALFHLVSLNYPFLNGDEALGGILIIEEIQKVFSGQLPQLHFVVNYIGPFDAWVTMAAFSLFSQLSQLFSSSSWSSSWPIFGQVSQNTHPAWILRISPLLFFIGGTFCLARELYKNRPRLAGIFLLIMSGCPVAWVHSRINWSSSFLLGFFSLLLAEFLRARRTQRPRWLLLGFLAGISMELHPTASIGVVGLAMMNFQLFQKAWKNSGHTSQRKPKSWLKPWQAERNRLVFGLLIFFALILPEIFHPPVVVSHGEKALSSWKEIVFLYEVIVGHRPLSLSFVDGLFPNLFYFPFFAVFLWVMIWHWKQFKVSSPNSEDRRMAFDRRVILFMSVFVLFFCLIGRSLRFLGHERYLLFLVPLWGNLLSESFFRFTSVSKLRWFVVASFLFFFAICGQIRLTYCLKTSKENPDPSLIAAHWLMQECPRDRCLAHAENFWNYWPITYYSKRTIDLNVFNPSWRHEPVLPRNGRELAACWYSGDLSGREPYSGKWRKKITIPPQGATAGQVCYVGMEL